MEKDYKKNVYNINIINIYKYCISILKRINNFYNNFK